MHILVIGNGFDLAHGLPTRYTDFLKYCRDYDEALPISSSAQLNEEFLSIIQSNAWYRYFLDTTDLDDERTWIDFEKEIAKITQDIELKDDKATFLQYVDRRCLCTRDEIIKCIYQQLRDFARAFEIYCLRINYTDVVSVITTECKDEMNRLARQVETYANQARLASGYTYRKAEAAQYEKLRDEASHQYSALSSKIRMIDALSLSKFDAVLSFNYTNTYERLYGDGHTKYCYIHGKAQADSKKTNIILGINDELEHGAESKDFTWVNFKKYYQRIIFQTGSEYKEWLESQRYDHAGKNYVHIVGHSLDRTDYEVLYELFMNPNFKIIIYYYNENDFEEKVQRVIRLLAYHGKNGRDELIQRVHGPQWSIKFVNQYDEEDGLFIK